MLGLCILEKNPIDFNNTRLIPFRCGCECGCASSYTATDLTPQQPITRPPQQHRRDGGLRFDGPFEKGEGHQVHCAEEIEDRDDVGPSIEIEIKGMSCTRCAGVVQRAL